MHALQVKAKHSEWCGSEQVAEDAHKKAEERCFVLLLLGDACGHLSHQTPRQIAASLPARLPPSFLADLQDASRKQSLPSRCRPLHVLPGVAWEKVNYVGCIRLGRLDGMASPICTGMRSKSSSRSRRWMLPLTAAAAPAQHSRRRLC